MITIVLWEMKGCFFWAAAISKSMGRDSVPSYLQINTAYSRLLLSTIQTGILVLLWTDPITHLLTGVTANRCYRWGRICASCAATLLQICRHNYSGDADKTSLLLLYRVNCQGCYTLTISNCRKSEVGRVWLVNLLKLNIVSVLTGEKVLNAHDLTMLDTSTTVLHSYIADGVLYFLFFCWNSRIDVFFTRSRSG